LRETAMKTSQAYYDAKTKSYWYMPLGKHEGELIPRLLFTHPHYINWCLHNMTEGVGVKAVGSIKYFIGLFDRRPARIRCQGRPGCRERARYLAVKPAVKLAHPKYVCSRCVPEVKGYGLIETYGEALEFVEKYCRGSIVEFSKVIKYLSQGKGWRDKGKTTDMKVIRFFGLNGNHNR